MSDIIFLRALGLMVVAAAGFLLLARLAGVPSIVAYIVAGLVVGPATGAIDLTEAIEIISETGIVLLLFLVGLELSLDKIKNVGKAAIVIGLGQVGLTVVLGGLMAAALGFSVTEAVFLGIAMTFSSTVVAVKLLAEKGEFESLYGRIAIGVLLVQDLVVVALLTFLSGLQEREGLDVEAAASGLLGAFGGMGLMIVLAALAARYALPRLFTWISSSLEAMFIWSLCWCFLLVVLAELLHLSVELGAFIAGVSLAQLPFNHELRRRVHPMMNFFIAIFFATLGVQMDLGAAVEQILPGLALSLFVLLGKPLIFFFLVPRMGFGRSTTFNIAVTLAQISEFSFIFAALGMSTGLIGEEVLAVVGMVGLTTIAVSSYMIKFSQPLYEKVRAERWLHFFGTKEDPPQPEKEEHQDHIVVIGLNSLGLRLVEELLKRGETVLAIDTDPTKLRRLDCATILGSVDHPNVLEEANIAEAKLVISALQIEDTNNLLAYRCKQLEVPCSIHAFDRSVVEELREIGANHLMIPKNNGIKRILKELRSRGVVGT